MVNAAQCNDFGLAHSILQFILYHIHDCTLFALSGF